MSLCMCCKPYIHVRALHEIEVYFIITVCHSLFYYHKSTLRDSQSFDSLHSPYIMVINNSYLWSPHYSGYSIVSCIFVAARMKKEIEFLQGAFESYKTSLHQETDDKWNRKQEDLMNELEAQKDKEIHELSMFSQFLKLSFHSCNIQFIQKVRCQA